MQINSSIFIYNTIIEHIQGLRGIAVLFVLLFHFYPNIFNGGFIGVDLFFCISGYVITISLKKRIYKNYYFSNFYCDRIKRLSPASFIVILCVMYGGNSNNVITNKKKLLDCFFSIISLTNFYFIKEKLDYFSSSDEYNSILTHFWSLSIENQFYIIYPVLFIILKEKNELYYIFLLLCIIYSTYITKLNSVVAYLYTIPRICEFFTGAISSYSKQNIKWKVHIYFIDFFAFLLLFGFTNNIDYPSYYILIPCIYVFAYFNMIKNSYYFLTNLLFFKSIGKISYSLYLVHYPICISKDRLYLKIFKILFYTTILYEIFEKPFMYRRFNNFLVVTIYSCVVTIMMYITKSKIHHINKKLVKSFINFEKYNKNYANECILNSNSINYILNKEYVILFGDSRMEHLIPSLYPIFKEKNYILLSILFWTDSIKYKNYIEIINKFKKLNYTPTYIILSFRLYWHVSDIRHVNNTFLIEDFYLFTKYLKEFNSPIYLFGDTLLKAYSNLDCYFNRNRKCTCKINENCFFISYPNFILSGIKYIDLNKYICNYTSSECNEYYKQIPVYIDNSHFNVIYTLSIRELLKKELNINISKNNKHVKYFQCDYKQLFYNINIKRNTG